ncbi:hypothetical protein ABFX02_03G042700 [Erythranthe guttata]
MAEKKKKKKKKKSEMDFVTLLLIFLYLTFFHVLVTKLRNTKLPPGPFPLPIIGNILHLGGNGAHRSFAKLPKTYGPLMYLKLGIIQTIVRELLGAW